MSNSDLANLPSFLSQVSFFSEVSDDSLAHLIDHLISKKHLKNEVIFKKDTIGDSLYVIYQGKVKIHDEDHIYDFLEEGDCFGEYALIDQQKRSATVTCAADSTLLKIDRKQFLALMAQDTGFAQAILAVMIKRHRELDHTQKQLSNSKEEIELINAKMSGLINGAMDAIIMFSQDFRIILTNPSAHKLLENDDILQRNVLFFLDEQSAHLIETLTQTDLSDTHKSANNYLPSPIKVLGSKGGETLNEGTLSKYGTDGAFFYTLILRNIENRLEAENEINLLTNQTKYLEEEIDALTHSYGIIAEDDSMKQVLNLIRHVAPTDSTVLINGETGTGKELVARAIHKASDRNDKPLIRINCGAIPTNLIESELFGHEKGAFTGATVSRKGRFLLADKGTIFLDEIGELPLDLQPKLLRIIQEGEFDPVGSSITIKVDVRIIAATHRNLFEYAKEGHFREDLYYRLNVFPIQVPPLRERGHDISLIAEEIIKQFSSKLNRPIKALSQKDRLILHKYDWPGNVRELQNLIERAVIISQNGKIQWETIIPSQNEESSQQQIIPEQILTDKELELFEKENILRALRKTKWKISGKNGAAALLQIPPTTLNSKIKAQGIERPI